MADTERLPALTGLRGIAALWVVAFHAWALSGGTRATWDTPWLAVASAGWLGVDVFFVLSGFLLASSVMRGAESAIVDWSRVVLLRAVRILPAYWAQLVALAALGALGLGGAVAWRPVGVGDALAHATLWLNAAPWTPAHLGPWWSLSVEAVFYLSLPLLAWALRTPRRIAILLIAGALLAVLWRMQVQAVAPGIEQRIGWAEHAPGRWVQFVAGALLARLWWSCSAVLGHSSTPRATSRASAWRNDLGVLSAFAALALLPLWPALGGDRPYNGVVDERAWTWAWPLLTTVPVAVLLWCAAEGRGLAGRLLASAPLRAVGAVSFSLYLWHYPVQWWLRAALGGYVPSAWGLAGFAAASLVLSLLVATVSWWAVERPALAAARRWAQRRRGKLRAP